MMRMGSMSLLAVMFGAFLIGCSGGIGGGADPKLKGTAPSLSPLPAPAGPGGGAATGPGKKPGGAPSAQ